MKTGINFTYFPIFGDGSQGVDIDYLFMFISEKKNSAGIFIQCWSNLGQFQECCLNIFYISHKKVQAWYYLPTNSSNGVSEVTGL